ncbi:MAG: Arc family DNA-binding protein [Pseudomonadota bacterium]
MVPEWLHSVSEVEPSHAHLSIKSVPEALAESLRQRAARNHRSLQGELMAILEAAVHETPIPVTLPACRPRKQVGRLRQPGSGRHASMAVTPPDRNSCPGT